MKILQGAYGDGIHDNTYLRAAKNAHFRPGDHAQCSLMDNDGLYKRCTNNNITVEGGIWDGNNSMQQRIIIDNENLPCDYDEYIENQLAIFMIRFVNIKNLNVKNITFKDSTSYAIHIADAKYPCFKYSRLFQTFCGFIHTSLSA